MQPQKRDICEIVDTLRRIYIVVQYLVYDVFLDVLDESPIPRFQKTKKNTYPVLNKNAE